MLRVTLVSCLFLALAVNAVHAQEPAQMPLGSTDDAAAVAKSVPELAKRVIAVYHDDDQRRFLDNLFRLRLVIGEDAAAARTISQLRTLEPLDGSLVERTRHLQYFILAHARARQAASKTSFESTFQYTFREVMLGLDDKTSAHLVRTFIAIGPSQLQRELLGKLEQHKGKSSISLPDALDLIKSYQVDDAYRSFAPLTPQLIDEDDARRYFVDRDAKVRIADGGTVCTLMMRPRRGATRIPALLQYTIYVDGLRNLADARRAASNGYASVIGLTRGKGCGPDDVKIYERDPSDAAALIDWISEQPWSDGRVGMYGGSYSGFTQWAAAKQMPKALKALMPQAPAAPGIDVPMEGNVFWNFVYPYPFYTTNTKGLDDATYNDSERWRRLDRNWYVSGRPYRDMDKIDGTPNPHWHKWIEHPSYDSYWQNLIPYGKEFAKIDIPVLTTAGYYYGGPGAAVYYLAEHYKHNPAAEHYLVIGPYEHFIAQRGTIDAFGNTTDVIDGYRLDPVAQIDMGELRFQWFSYVLMGGPKPELLKDKINYQVTGANVWKHAPSLAAMATETRRFHLGAARTGEAYVLSEKKPASGEYVTLTVNMADRSDVDRVAPGGSVSDQVDTWNAVEFVSEPLSRATEVSGLFSGHLAFITNKRDFDFNVQLYELTPKGEYVALPPYWSRASYVRDLSHRRLLTPGKRQELDFKSIRLMSRLFQSGSRLVLVLGAIREPGREINYGSGKEVSEEGISDAGKPLSIKWLGDSFIDIPVSN